VLYICNSSTQEDCEFQVSLELHSNISKRKEEGREGKKEGRKEKKGRKEGKKGRKEGRKEKEKFDWRCHSVENA
jgi:hypothetical protein